MHKVDFLTLHRRAWPLIGVLALPLIVQGTLVAGLVSYFAYQSGQRDLETLAEQLRQQTSRRIHDHLDVNLSLQTQALQVTLQAVQQGQLDLNNPEQVRQFLWQQISLSPKLSFITFASEQGEEIGYGRIQSQALKRQVDKQLSRPITLNAPFLVQRSGPDQLNRPFYLVDSQGKPTQEIYHLPQDTRQFIWYQQARQSKGINWSSVHVNYVMPSLHIAATVPLYDAQGQFQGVLSNPFPLSTLNTFISDLNFSPSGQIFILDQAGHLLTSPDDEPLFHPFRPSGKVTPQLLKATESRHPWIKAIATELQQNYSQVVREEPNLHLHFPVTVQGEKLFVDIQRYRDPFGLNWLVVVVLPETDILRAVQSNQQQSGFLFLGSVLLGTGISLLISRWITRPLIQLNQASQAFAKRQQANPILPISPIQEINDLAQSFNQMAKDIEASQTQLQSQNHQLQQFLNAVPFGIRILDRQGRLQYANQQADILTGDSIISGNSQGELVMRCPVFVAGSSLPYPLENMPLMQALNGVAHYAEDIDYHHNERIIPMAAWGTPIYNAAGELEYGMVVFQDISERKQFEHQLQQANEELTQANRLKDDFLATMSHELRTPLNAVLGMSESLQEEIFGPITSQQRQALETIENSGYHLLNLINDILDISSINAGKLKLDSVLTAISSVCRDSLALVQSQANRKQLHLNLRLPQALPQLLVDERRLRQCLMNLLSNAVKFTPSGGQVSLEVRFPAPRLPLADIPPYLRLSVLDTGIGIAPEHLERLFQPFSQIDSRLNRKYEGTGLGLYLVKRMVELQGGEVGVSSELGAGSCFWIDLPCPEGTLIPETIEDEMMSAVALAASGVKPAPLILLADDNPASVITIQSYLEAKGYRLMVAEDGESAIRMTDEHQPQLILMDIQMPKLNGIQAIEQLRQNPQFQELPIIALTALAMEGDEQRCLAAGASAYLSKPVKLKQLLHLIESLQAGTNSVVQGG